ncbi:MAG: glycosyltransferase family 2 protein, partial [Methanobrevibacter sp.]|nr:glycosyltransferase family 2 protein [Methanobrevibacter sp.]
FENIELILYDDNSKDNSREVILKYANKFDNIVPIFSNQNSGYPGRGRNKGIEIAKGNYIMFMDNDDEFKNGMCEILYNEIISENADIVGCNSLNIDIVSSKIEKPSYRNGSTKNNDKITFKGKEVSDFTCPIIWTKIFRKEMIIENNIKFPEDKLFEDVYFMYLSYMYCNKLIYLTNYVGHIRYDQKESLSRSQTSKQSIEAIEVCYDVIKEYDKNQYKVDLDWLFSDIIQCIMIFSYNSSYASNKEEVRKLLKEVYKFEKDIDFNGSLGLSLNIANFFVKKQQFNLAILYVQPFRYAFSSKILRKLYRKFN